VKSARNFPHAFATNGLVTWFALALLILAPALHAAELQLASVFSDHMVLQREKPIRIWGTAAAHAQVAVEFAGQRKTASANAEGEWIAILDPLSASSEPQELIVTSSDLQTKVADILVGEVWLLGGQSNMEMPLWWRGDSDGLKNAKDTRLTLGTDHPWLRIMTVPFRVARKPQSSFPQTEKDGDGVVTGRWFVAQDKHPAISGFSALGYFMAVQLHEKLGVPIGMIDTSVGGTIASAWNSRESLDGIPEATAMVERKEAAANAWTEADARQQLAKEMAEWESRAAAAKAENKNPPGKPSLKPDPGQDRNFPAGPFNAMIWPLRHFAIRGVFFYQGENNFFDREDPFAKTFPGVVRSWRLAFAAPDLPFCIFQICGWGSVDLLYHQTKMPIIQEAQHKAHLALPNTGFVVTTDYPHVDIHPMVKRVIAERALRWARTEVYGEKGLTWGSPALESSRREGSQMILTFRTYGNEALLLKGVPAGLVIAGSDGKFVEAKVKIVNRTSLAVWNEAVPEPTMVRYGWSQRAICHLFSASGLPVGPFRTDEADIPPSAIRD
jgi:sialate O-acetylesterase